MSASIYAPDYLRRQKDEQLHRIAEMIERQCDQLSTQMDKLHRAKEIIGEFHADLSPIQKQFHEELENLFRVPAGSHAEEFVKKTKEEMERAHETMLKNVSSTDE